MKATNQAARQFLEEHTAAVQPLLRQANLASWTAATTGREEAIQESARARTAVKQLYADREDARRVRELLSSSQVEDALLRRQLVLLDHQYTAHQLSAEAIADLTFREAELEQIFYNFRARIGDREVPDNELRELLRTERDSERRREVWEASKAIGLRTAEPLRELVRRRNEAARSLGFDNYYSMELQLQEIDEDTLFGLLEEFRLRSDESFGQMRERIDGELSARYGVPPGELRPWHWEDFFSQDAPSVGEVDLDPLFLEAKLEAVARDYFAELGLPADDVLARSDLYEREGKDQHAFCTDIDREGDVRMLCNLRPNEKWMRTLLHELGHAVYDKFIPRDLPFLLRVPAHTLATESIAMYFGRLTREASWLREVLGAELTAREESDIHEQQRLSMLVSARWILVMAHFERALYRDPDRADLDALWWELVEDLQLIRRPDGRDAPDWATKIHLSLAPVYYHNYLLGELMASQLTYAMREQAGPGGDPADGVGGFLRERVFSRGAILPWNELVREATGEALTAHAFLEQFVAEPLPGGT